MRNAHTGEPPKGIYRQEDIQLETGWAKAAGYCCTNPIALLMLKRILPQPISRLNAIRFREHPRERSNPQAAEGGSE
jgi:hypothetical protein